MNIFNKIQDLLAELLDVEKNEISPETYIFRDLGAESIDLMELAVAINSEFNINVIDDDIFLRRLREYISENQSLKKKYPFLPDKRIAEIIKDVGKRPDFSEPVLKVKDLIDYIKGSRPDHSTMEKHINV